MQPLPVGVDLLPDTVKPLPVCVDLLPDAVKLFPTGVDLLPDAVELPAAGVDLLPAAVSLLLTVLDLLPVALGLLPAGIELLPVGVDLLHAGVDLLPAVVHMLPAGVNLLSAAADLLPAAVALVHAIVGSSVSGAVDMTNVFLDCPVSAALTPLSIVVAMLGSAAAVKWRQRTSFQWWCELLLPWSFGEASCPFVGPLTRGISTDMRFEKLMALILWLRLGSLIQL